MISSQIALLALGVVCTPHTSAPVDTTAGTNREALYRQGITFDVFLDQAVKRRQMWLDNFAKGRVPDALQSRVLAVPGRWRLLVVAVDSCSDSANTIPYLAHLVAATDNLEMRIIDSDVGRPVMEAHRTPDGRAATPTVVLLNDRYEEVGCFIERPAELQTWAIENRDKLDDREYMRQKFAWYDNDVGHQTMSEVVALMEEAAAGRNNCES